MSDTRPRPQPLWRPRVRLTYDLEACGITVARELPFVLGVLGDFAGDPTQRLTPLAERSFLSIDRDNFDHVMARIAPGLKIPGKPGAYNAVAYLRPWLQVEELTTSMRLVMRIP
jgi:type VI secretion system ImpB/VipA family protein